MTYTEKTTIHVRFQPGEQLPKVDDVREAKGLAHWNYRVLQIINVSDPDEGQITVKMRVQRWLAEEEGKTYSIDSHVKWWLQSLRNV